MDLRVVVGEESMRAVQRLLLKADAERQKADDASKRSEDYERKAAMLCEHPDAGMREYKPEYGAPWVICLSCGYAEEAWGVGTWKLRYYGANYSSRPRIEFVAFLEARRVMMSQREIEHGMICVPSHGKPKDRAKCDGVCKG